MDLGETMLMTRKRKTAADDDRVMVIALKGTQEDRDWFAGLVEATMIPGASIVRDALAMWAEARELPPPPGRAVRPKGPPRKPRRG